MDDTTPIPALVPFPGRSDPYDNNTMVVTRRLRRMPSNEWDQTDGQYRPGAGWVPSGFTKWWNGESYEFTDPSGETHTFSYTRGGTPSCLEQIVGVSIGCLFCGIIALTCCHGYLRSSRGSRRCRS